MRLRSVLLREGAAVESLVSLCLLMRTRFPGDGASALRLALNSLRGWAEELSTVWTLIFFREGIVVRSQAGHREPFAAL